MSDDPSLDEQQQTALGHELIAPDLVLSEPVQNPVAILTAGQPGSGKSSIVRSMTVRFEGYGRSIAIDPDNVRLEIPYMQTRIAQGNLDIPNSAFRDAGVVAHKMMQEAAGASRNIIIDGTLSNSHYAVEKAQFLKAAGYHVEVHGMAVAPDLSHASTYERRELQIQSNPTKFGRGVGDDFHDAAVTGLLETITTLQAQGNVDAIVFYDRAGKEIAASRLVDGKWTPAVDMAEKVRHAQANPDIATKIDAVVTWSNAAELMRDRGADATEQRKVDDFRDAAIARAPNFTLTPPVIDITHAQAQNTVQVRDPANLQRDAGQIRAAELAAQWSALKPNEHATDPDLRNAQAAFAVTRAGLLKVANNDPLAAEPYIKQAHDLIGQQLAQGHIFRPASGTEIYVAEQNAKHAQGDGGIQPHRAFGDAGNANLPLVFKGTTILQNEPLVLMQSGDVTLVAPVGDWDVPALAKLQAGDRIDVTPEGSGYRVRPQQPNDRQSVESSQSEHQELIDQQNSIDLPSPSYRKAAPDSTGPTDQKRSPRR